MLLPASRQIVIHSFGFCIPIIVCEEHALGISNRSVGDNRLQRLNNHYGFDGNEAVDVKRTVSEPGGIAIDAPSPVD